MRIKTQKLKVRVKDEDPETAEESKNGNFESTEKSEDIDLGSSNEGDDSKPLDESENLNSTGSLIDR